MKTCHLFYFSFILMNKIIFFLQTDIESLSTQSEMIEEMVDVYLNVFPFLHADDTVLIVESTQQLQNQLNHFETIARSRI